MIAQVVIGIVDADIKDNSPPESDRSFTGFALPTLQSNSAFNADASS